MMANPLESQIEEAAGELEEADADRLQAKAAFALASRWRWESLLEDTAEIELEAERGKKRSLEARSRDAERNRKRQLGSAGNLSTQTPLRRGMIRFVYLLIDMTDASKLTDYKPKRIDFMVECAGRFAEQFLAENPLAEIGLMVLRSGICEVISSLSSNAAEFRRSLADAASEGPKGRFSVVSGLQRALTGLEGAPPYGTREVIVLFTSTSTCDPQDMPIETLLPQLSEKKIRISVLSISPEVYAMKRICAETGGSFDVALAENHFKEQLLKHTAAPPCTARGIVPRLIRMGFPVQLGKDQATETACACHLRPCARLFVCPQCHARSCSMPSRCRICDLPLASAPLLARAFRSLVPIPPFAEEAATASSSSDAVVECCRGCCLPLDKLAELCSSCPTCKSSFCEACDDFIHGSLRQCPGCLEKNISIV
eukprot:TRINITY_DN27961_c0_g1_i2.p1 TRINITY_DN27961_c0_g1~~TRINITY_DN27961_c0_g1_i2.p1  ORF type:complete len:428 (-),score=79.15 TRINITY_DN27961_c0_g1_i2:92-1375(-)